LCGGCTEFAHGVVDEPMRNDVRLVGYWVRVDDTKKGYIRITEESPTILRIDEIDQKKCKDDGPAAATRTEINGISFLDVTIPQRDSSKPLVIPVEYEFDDHGQLLIGGPPPDEELERAIENGELPGRIIKCRSSGAEDKSVACWGDSIYVDASTAELRQFLAVHSGSMAKPAIAFRRPASAALQCDSGSLP
jgi:hypothetical protein